MRHDEGLTMGSFRLKLVGYFLLLALIPLAGFFFGFRQVAESSETHLVDARMQAGLRASSAALQERIASATRPATELAGELQFVQAVATKDRLDAAAAPPRAAGPERRGQGRLPRRHAAVVRGRAPGSGVRPGGLRRLGDRLGQARLGPRGEPPCALGARLGGRDRDPRPRPGRGGGSRRPRRDDRHAGRAVAEREARRHQVPRRRGQLDPGAARDRARRADPAGPHRRRQQRARARAAARRLPLPGADRGRRVPPGALDRAHRGRPRRRRERARPRQPGQPREGEGARRARRARPQLQHDGGRSWRAASTSSRRSARACARRSRASAPPSPRRTTRTS